MKDKKRPTILWDAVSGSLTLVLFPYSSRRPRSFKMKPAWSDTSIIWPQKPKRLLRPFSTWVLTGATISTKRTHRAPTFMAQSPPTLEMACTVVELMILICRKIGSNHRWNLMWASVTYYCFSDTRRGGAFSGPSSVHPQLVHIYESMLCKETPVSLWNFVIFLPVILVYNFHLLIMLQYLCLYLCLINSASWEFCNTSACNFDLKIPHLENFALSLPVFLFDKFCLSRIFQYFCP